MWWLIIPIAAFIIILCIVLNEAHERQVKQSARMPLDDSWLFDNVDEPYREFEFETSDETEIFKDMTDRIKLGDMTLKQIRELKQRIRDEINSAIEKATSGYDVGVVLIDTDIDVFRDACGTPYHYDCNMTIKFSKEDE